MALQTIVGEKILLMIGSICVVCLMTRHTDRRCPGKLPARMTEFAIDRAMGTCECEISFVVIKCCGVPRCCGMAQGTVLVKTTRHVIRIGDPRIVGLVTGNTCRLCSSELSSRMTKMAINHPMSTGQWKICCRMVKGGRFPSNGGMARRAIVGELTHKVLWTQCRGEIGLVAYITLSRRSGISICRMARSASRSDVCAGEWEIRS